MVRYLKLTIILILVFTLIGINIYAIPTKDRSTIKEELNSFELNFLDQDVKKEPSTVEDHYKLGLSYLSQNMPQLAIQQFEKALKLNPSHSESMLGLAISSMWLGDNKSANQYINNAIQLDPKDPKLYNAAGIIRMSTATNINQLEEAVSKFKEAIALEPKSITPRMNLATLYMSMKRPKEAVEEYKKIINIQPNNLLARAGLVTAYLHNNQTENAKAEAYKIAEIAPNDPIAHNALGELYLQDGQLDKAMERFQKAVNLQPNFADGYKNIGHVYFFKGSIDSAIEQYNKALKIKSNDGEAYAALGNAYVKKGMIKNAEEQYQNSVKFLPASTLISVPVYNNLAYIYTEQDKKLDEALLYAQRAKQLAPDHPDVNDTLGWVYYKKGNYKEALDNLKIAVEKAPDKPSIRYHLGLVYIKQGDKNKAKEELNKALSIDPNFPEAVEARKILKNLGN